MLKSASSVCWGVLTSFTIAVTMSLATFLNADEDALESLQAKSVIVGHEGDGFRCTFSRHADGLELLPHVGNVKSVKLNSTDVSDDQIQVVSQLKDLESIYIQHTKRLTDSAFTHFADLQRLQIIAADGNDQLTDAALGALRPLSQLRWLSLVGSTRITDHGLASLRGMKHLQSLDIGSEISWSETTFFSPSQKISLGVKPTSERIDVTDVGLRHLSGLTDLVFLRLSGTKISDKGLTQLRKLEQLRTLDLSHTDITAEGIEQLRACSQLEWLNLNLCFAIDDKALAQVANFRNLDELDLIGARLVSDAGLEHLTSLPLTTLDLRYTNISDGAIAHLKEMKKLETLDISDTRITEKGQEELETALPGCDVRR